MFKNKQNVWKRVHKKETRLYEYKSIHVNNNNNSHKTLRHNIKTSVK